jgi:hypothetical protein
MKTIAQQLNVTEFPFTVEDSQGNQIYYENSYGYILDNRPKSPCEGKIVEIEGKKYKLESLDS